MTATTDPFGTDMILRHGLGLAQLAATHAASTAVPTCGDWNLADLTWHLAEVQDFWLHIIGRRPAGPDSYDRPTRPPDDELAGLLRDRCQELADLLDGADQSEPAWSWSDDRTVGFTTRRQSHEALIHHVDALLATDTDLPDIDPSLAADGVDELVRVMLSGVPEWASYTPSDRTLLISATDTGHTWSLGLGRMTGTSPDTGTAYDLSAMEVIDGLEAPTTSIEATATELDLWMWGRSDDTELRIGGDPVGASFLRDAVVESTQ